MKQCSPTFLCLYLYVIINEIHFFPFSKYNLNFDNNRNVFIVNYDERAHIILYNVELPGYEVNCLCLKDMFCAGEEE